ncbi:MAG: hypothetical protein EWM46_11495, partial [Fermentimonas caenicola]
KLLVITFSILALTGCSSDKDTSSDVDKTKETTTESNAKTEDDKYVIGVTIPRLSNPFFGRAIEIIEAYADELDNVKLIVMDAEDESATQVQQVEDFISMKVDGVLAAPVVSDGFVLAAETLKEASIPLVTCDRMVNSEDILAHVGGNNVVGGEVAAEYIAEQLGEGNHKVAMLLGPLGASPTNDRKEGFDKIMKDYPNITVIEETGNFKRSEGMTVAENMLQANPDIKAIFSHNEEMGLGAIEALQALGYDPGEIVVVAFDTHLETMAAVDNGWLQGNVEQFPDAQFKTALDILLANLKDGTKPEKVYNYLDPKVITKDNIEESEKYEDYKASL